MVNALEAFDRSLDPALVVDVINLDSTDYYWIVTSNDGTVVRKKLLPAHKDHVLHVIHQLLRWITHT